MTTLIDWHAHHTAPELVERFVKAGRSAPTIDDEDSPDFSRRIADMDSRGVELQLVSQSAGLNADGFGAEQAMLMVHLSNDLIGERIAPFPDRLFATIATTLQDVPGSVAEIRRLAGKGFRAVMMYAQPDAIGRPETEPFFSTTAELGLPIFLHGGGAGVFRPPGLELLEDEGRGVLASALSEAAVSDCVVRMIAAGLFDRYPDLQVVIRSGGGVLPLLLNRLWWKHKGPDGEREYREILLEHFLADCASVNPRTLEFLVDQMGEDGVVFGSDYCGGSKGPLDRAIGVVEAQKDASRVKSLMEHNSRRLLGV
ncbi:MAG: aminocarboxymuconate-semialdehyde decarboxylase [Chloroflexi bacterium]|jgi:predicted TIM-barrel fold metal-dependent hydrolase|nr:MAG: aminocarboxymuconate-semialdehyde decarboxylase [Chloroflexota bacterium]